MVWFVMQLIYLMLYFEFEGDQWKTQKLFADLAQMYLQKWASYIKMYIKESASSAHENLV